MQYIDQMENSFHFAQTPSRIISLVPSQTELLWYLGLEDRVVGITKFCVHPDSWFREKTRVGGTKKVNFEAIERLEPDLIIGNKEENEKSDIAALSSQYPVWMSDIVTLEDAFDMMRRLGDLLDRKEKANTLVNQLQSGFEAIRAQRMGNNLSVAYFIWQTPMMVAASGTFIDEILTALGYRNVFEELMRYPVIEAVDLQKHRPDLIFLSSEPYPYQEKHTAFFQSLCPDAIIELVDGELFSWYGSRLLESVQAFGG